MSRQLTIGEALKLKMNYLDFKNPEKSKLKISKTKLTRILNNPAEADAKTILAISDITGISTHTLALDYGFVGFELKDLKKLGLVLKSA